MVEGPWRLRASRIARRLSGSWSTVRMAELLTSTGAETLESNRRIVKGQLANHSLDRLRIMIRRLLFLLLATTAFPLFASGSRTFEATYIATVKDVPAGLKEMTVWIPLPVSRGGQTVSDVRIESPQKWIETTERKFGDRYAHATIANPAAGDFVVKVHFRGMRNEVTMSHPAETRATQAEIARALKADKLVTLSPRVKKLAKDVTAGKTTPIGQAHAIYDYLLATMKYDKTIPG